MIKLLIFIAGFISGGLFLMCLRVFLYRLNKKAEEYKQTLDEDKQLLDDYLNNLEHG